MSSVAEDVTIPLTVLINSENTKVLFAEVDSDFTDILLSFLTLPLGKILLLFKKRYAEEAPVIGSLNTLYNSLANLDDDYFWTTEGKQMLLNPRSNLSDDCHNLKFNIDDSLLTKYFVCGAQCSYTTSKRHVNNVYSNRTVSLYYGNLQCTCGKLMNIEISNAEHLATVHHDGGVFAMKSSCNFTISDDMQIKPNASGFIVQNLRDIGITDTYGTVKMTIDVGYDEMVDLLKGLLLSQMPLTDFVRSKTQLDNAIEKSKPSTELQIEQKEESSSKKMVVKVALQKSTDKFLFAQVTEDFADFLFSLFTIPLGGVTRLLSGNTSLGSVDYLYRSVESFESKHLKTSDMKTRLLEPQLPCNYLSKCQVLPISEKVTKLYHYYVLAFSQESYNNYISSWAPADDLAVTVIDPKGKGSYLRSPGIFMVTDNLSVTPLSTISVVSLLNELRIPLSDVEDVEMEIGVNEALGILKESLTSTSVFTNALIKPILKRHPKQEYTFRPVKI